MSVTILIIIELYFHLGLPVKPLLYVQVKKVDEISDDECFTSESDDDDQWFPNAAEEKKKKEEENKKKLANQKNKPGDRRQIGHTVYCYQDLGV